MIKINKPTEDHFSWLILGVIFLFCVCAPYTNKWKALLTFSKSKPEQLWRFVTGHFTHWSWEHLILNLFGLVIFYFLFKKDVSRHSHLGLQILTVKSLISALTFILLITNFYIFFYYSFEYYLGFSSILYGLYSYCAVRCLVIDKVINGFILLTIFSQIQPWFTTYNSSTLIGLTSATDVHTIAVTSGLVLAGYHTVKQCFTKRI